MNKCCPIIHSDISTLKKDISNLKTSCPNILSEISLIKSDISSIKSEINVIINLINDLSQNKLEKENIIKKDINNTQSENLISNKNNKKDFLELKNDEKSNNYVKNNYVISSKDDLGSRKLKKIHQMKMFLKKNDKVSINNNNNNEKSDEIIQKKLINIVNESKTFEENVLGAPFYIEKEECILKIPINIKGEKFSQLLPTNNKIKTFEQKVVDEPYIKIIKKIIALTLILSKKN